VKIVCFGGGNALSKAVLVGLKNYEVDITTVTSMVDSGGSSGKLRKELNVLPPGDIRRHLIALSEAPQWKKDLFSFRFGSEDFGSGHVGHPFGNIFIALLECILKDYEKVLEIVHQFLEVRGKCLPSTIEKTNLYAILENGEIIEGEDEIDIPKKHNPKLRIKEIFIKPKAKAYEKTIKAVEESDAIIIGPGDLYSSILPCFLPIGMKDAISKSRAKKIFICPPLTKIGETNGFSVLDFSKEIEKYIGCPLDFVIYNNTFPSVEKLMKYKTKEPWVEDVVKINENLDKKVFIGENLLANADEIVYDANKVSKIIMRLVLKY
jgi:uncharacterized cofD-like protein